METDGFYVAVAVAIVGVAWAWWMFSDEAIRREFFNPSDDRNRTNRRTIGLPTATAIGAINVIVSMIIWWMFR
jgi:hypothetical protein